ncbi:hypothetical protein ACM66B_004817 [Microbotryomycetes sp. NB124-2]
MSKNGTSWVPPTPQSVLISTFSASTASTHVDDDVTFEPLPPAIRSISGDNEPISDFQKSSAFALSATQQATSLQSLLNPAARDLADELAVPGSSESLVSDQVPEAVRGCFASSNESLKTSQAEHSAVKGSSAHAYAASRPVLPGAEESNSQTRDESTRDRREAKRTKREAAATAQRSLPRRNSPPEELSPPPVPRSGTQHSNRRVSHSLIERRRREKINECLAHLKRLVPQCRVEGERKIARARERGRKRGRKSDEESDDSPRGGLHKLEILQGTIEYLEELEARLAALGAAGAGSVASNQNPTRVTARASLSDQEPGSELSSDLSGGVGAGNCADDQATAELLLNLSTSPELRPVVV